MTSAAVVRLEDVRFRWSGSDQPCIDIALLEVAAGERVFLHGASGSGKSTLLGLLGGVLSPERGLVRVLDRDLARTPSAERDRFRADHVGFLFQQFNLIPYLSPIENVLLPCRFSGRRRGRAAEAAGSAEKEAERLLHRLQIDAGLRRRPSARLSVGQQQRVAAARALIGGPELLIADEPTSSLDADRQAAFLELLLGECDAAGATLLLVSHDRRLAPFFSREIAIEQVNRAAAAGAPA
jgi:putative ABC transport system ATP-binding protein